MAAKTSTPEQHAAWHANMTEPQQNCCWCKENRDLKLEITSLQNKIQQLRDTLEACGHHTNNCILYYLHAYDPDKGFHIKEKWYKKYPKCECGLDEALAL